MLYFLQDHILLFSLITGLAAMSLHSICLFCVSHENNGGDYKVFVDINRSIFNAIILKEGALKTYCYSARVKMENI